LVKIGVPPAKVAVLPENIYFFRLEELLVAIEYNFHLLYNTDMYNHVSLFGTSGNSTQQYVVYFEN
jgi:hypothetical protein